MAWQLAFLDEALKEWRKLDSATASQFKKKLAERLENPRPNCVLTESSKHKQFDQNQGSGAQLRFRGNETRSRVPASRLHGSKERYKIKLRSSGYRLVYEVRDAQVLVLVVAVGKRDRNAVYRKADQR